MRLSNSRWFSYFFVFGALALNAVVAQQFSIAATQTQIPEAAGFAAFTITANSPVADGVEVTFTLTGVSGTATYGADFNLPSNPETISIFGDGETTAWDFSTEVTIVDDTLFEVSESFSVQISNPSSGSIGTGSISFTISNNDPQPRLFIVAANTSEPAGSVNVVFQLRNLANALTTSGADTTFTWSTNDGTATGTNNPVGAQDFIAQSTVSVLIPAGQSQSSATVTIVNDNTHEAEESFDVTVSNVAGGAAAPVAATVRFYIADDDAQPTIGFQATTVSFPEEGVISGGFTTSTVSLTLVLSAVPGVDVTVQYRTVAGTAVAGDFTSVPATSITFRGIKSGQNGETTRTITITVQDDQTYEPNETFTVELIAGTATEGTIDGANSVVSITIIDNDAAPLLQVAVTPTLEENPDNSATTAGVTFTPSRISGLPITFNYATRSGNNADPEFNAISGVDFTSVSGSATIPAGSTSATVVIPITPDAKYERDESFFLDITNWVGVSGLTGTVTVSGATASSDIVIPNNDPYPVLTIVGQNVSEPLSGTTTAVFTVSKIGETDLFSDVLILTTPGTATDDVDYAWPANYNATYGRVQLPGGVSSATYEIDIFADALDEDDETYTVELIDPLGTGVGVNSRAEAFIFDSTPPPFCDIDGPSSVQEGAAGNTAPMFFGITLSAQSGKQVQVDVQFTAGTATADVDFQPSTVRLTWDPLTNTLSKSASVTVIGDDTNEGDETIIVTLINPVNCQLRASSTATGTIVEDDAVPTLGITSRTVTEGANVLVTATLSRASAFETRFVWWTVDVTASSVLGPRNDYVGVVTGSGVIAAGATSVNLGTISTTNDPWDEPATETFQIRAFPNTTNVPQNEAIGTITINDNDAPPSFTVAAISLSEGGGAMIFNVSLTLSGERTYTVDYATQLGVNGAVNAAESTDFTAVSGTLVFDNFASYRTVSVPINDDGVDEPDEFFNFVLSNPTPASGGTPAILTPTVTGTIVDNDATPTLTVSVQSTVAEPITSGDTTPVTVTFSLDTQSETQITVDWDIAGFGTHPASFADFSASVGTITFAPFDTEETRTVTIVGDGIDEYDEDVIISLSNYVIPVTADSVGFEILDFNDPPTISIANIGSVSEAEGTILATITLSGPTAKEVSFDIDTLGIDTEASDYTAVAASRSGSAGPWTFEITINDDSIDEYDESFLVGLSNIVNADPGTTSRTVTILDNDAAPFIVVTNPDPAEFPEGNAANTVTLTVGLSGQTEKLPITLGWSTQIGSAPSPRADGSDVELTTDFVTFSSDTQTLEFDIYGDDAYEADENFQIQFTGNPTEVDLSENTFDITILNDDPFPTISIDDATTTEGFQLSFGVHLSALSSEDVTFTICTTNVETDNSDYAAECEDNTYTIPALSTDITITINTNDDSVYEGTETFLLDILFLTGAEIGDIQALGTINDNEATPNLFIDDITVNEPDTGSVTATFTVSMSPVSKFDVDFAFSTSDGDAIAEDDYASLDSTATIFAGDSFTTITVTIYGDNLYELDQSFFVDLGIADVNVEDGKGECVIVDFESFPQVTVNDVSGFEADAGQTTTLTFTITIDPQSEFPLDLTYYTSPVDATADGDYASVNVLAATITDSVTVDVTINGDDTYENDEDFTLFVDVEGSTDSATGTILNDDPVPVVSIESDITVVEGNSGFTDADLTILLDRLSEIEGSVTFTTTAGSAVAGQDFTSVTTTVTLTAGLTSFTATVPVVADTTDEDDESFTVSISSPVNAALGTSSRTVTIADDDASPTISIDDLTLDEGVGASFFTVTMNQASGRTVGFNWALVDTDSHLTVDFTMAPTSGTINLPAGQTSATISFTIIDDSLDEDDEFFHVDITAADSNTVSVSKGTGWVTIVDNDVAPTIDLTPISVVGGVSGAAVVEPDTPNTVNMNFRVGLSGPSGKTITVDFATADGTAAAPSDYTAKSTTVTFLPGDTTQTVSVVIKGDNLEEDDETFTATLSNGVNVNAGTTTATGTIVDNEPDVVVSVADKVCAEATANCVFTISSNVASQFAVNVGFATSAGTAENGRDYNDVSGTATIASGATTATFTVPITNDNMDEFDEVFDVTLTGTSRGTLGDSEAIGTITDDDAAPSVSFASSTYTVTETDSNDNFPIDIVLSRESGKTVTVNYAATASSAISGEDYILASGSLTFTPGNPGQTEKTVTIVIVGDLVSEYSEHFVVSLSSPSNAVLGTATTTVNIDDNDPDPTFDLVDYSPANAEDDSGQSNDLTFVITRSAATEKTFTITYFTSGVDAIEGVDYQGRSGTVSFAPTDEGVIINVPTIGDDTYELDEDFDITIDINDDSETMLTATGTILNDDIRPIIHMATSDVSVLEGNSGTTTVTITVAIDTTVSDVSSFDTSVTVNYDDGSAASTGSLIDWVDGVDTVTIPAGSTSATFTVTINGDIYYEADEDFVISLSNPNNGAELDSEDFSVVVTILNDDEPPVVSIHPKSITLPEGTNPADIPEFVYTITLEGANALPVVIEAIAISDSAVSGSDFDPLDALLNFPPGSGQRNQTVTVYGHPDSQPETDERFDVVVSVFDADEVLDIEAVVDPKHESAEGVLESDDSCVIDGAIGGCCIVPSTGPLRLDIDVCFPGMYPGYFFHIKENYKGEDVDPNYNVPEQWIPTGSGMHVKPHWGEEEVFDFLFIDGYPMTITVDVAQVPFPKWTYWNDELIKWSPAAGTCGQDRRSYNGTMMTVNNCHLTQFHLMNELPARDPHLEWHYKVICGDMTNPRIDGFFTSVTGISNQNEWECERFTHVNGREVSSCLPSQFVVKPLVAQRILTLNSELWEWRDLVANGQLSAARENCTILLYDRAYNPSIAFTIFNAWPGSIEVKALGTMDDYLVNAHGTTPRTARSPIKRDPGSVALVETVTFLHEGLTREGFARPKIILPPGL